MQTDPKKLHVGFPEKNREKYANTLVDNGYRVIVVEQVKAPKDGS
jgi:DNA mismatch repair ATPase MutS